MEALTGLVKAANESSDSTLHLEEGKKISLEQPQNARQSIDGTRREERASRRTRIPADIWQDTLSLVCDADPTVRQACINAIMQYITQEMPKSGESTDVDGLSQLRKLADNSFRHIHATAPYIADSTTRFLNHVHAYLYILATSQTLGLPIGDPTSPVTSNNAGPSSVPANNRRSSTSQHDPKARKQTLVLKLVANAPTHAPSVKATEEDYASILKVLSMIQVQLPMRGLVAGVPMLIALDEASRCGRTEPQLLQRILAMKTIIAHVWLTIGQVWKISELVDRAEEVYLSLKLIFSRSKFVPRL